MCAEDTPVGQWKYTDGQSWHRDSSLKIRCVERELPECVYNDQTDFEGGDLPEALGGGGLVTSATSSAECISEFSALMEKDLKMSANEFYQEGMKIKKKDEKKIGKVVKKIKKKM